MASKGSSTERGNARGNSLGVIIIAGAVVVWLIFGNHTSATTPLNGSPLKGSNVNFGADLGTWSYKTPWGASGSYKAPKFGIGDDYEK